MKKLFQYLNESKKTIFVIFLLLVVQAFCDLSLPTYTSKIVDKGIQQQGIENAVPEKMRPETLDSLSYFMTDEDEDLVRESYTKNNDGEMVLNKIDKKHKDTLNETLSIPMVILSLAQESEEFDLAGMQAMEAAGLVSKEQILEKREQMVEQLGDNSALIIQQKAIPFVKSEYEAMGVDMGDYQMNYLLKEGAKMLGLAILAMIVSVFAGMIASYTAAQLGMNLRGRVFKKVLSFSNTEMDKLSTASLITRSTNDIQQIQMVSVILLRMIMYAPILGIGGVIKVASTKTGMGWIIAVAVGVILIIVGILMGVAMPKFKKMQILLDKLNLVSREILTGLPVIRAFSREKHEEARFADANQELMSTQLFTTRVMTFMMPLMLLIMNGLSVLIVWVGGHGINAGNLQVGDMMAFISYTMQIVMSFLMLTMISVMLPRAGVSADRVDEILQTDASIKEPEHPSDDKLIDAKGEVVFEDVSFRYPGADEDALEHLSFTAKPGQTTAIIGSTGCGKSTLVHLIPRFYDATSGKITIDGVDIRELSMHKLRGLLGFVPQKGVLFSGDIESNIKFAKVMSNGEQISDEQMKNAAQIAQAEDFIGEKPERYNSSVAQGGTNVSGGQKQRLSIARAIAKDPKVFLFDDSFSALDYKTDILLRQALSEKIHEATVIIVAQRISTILHADQIIILDDGKIAAIGTHSELLKSCEEYQEIAKSQLSEVELDGGQTA